MKGIEGLSFVWLLHWVFLPATLNAFTMEQRRRNGLRSSTSNTALGSGDLFENFRNLFGGNNNQGSQNEDETANDVAAVKSIKRGGLRLFLMFYLMGLQNTPEKGFWRADQPSSEDYVLEMRFYDSTGMIIIELMEDQIMITRCGSLPSTAYLIQESFVVQGVLDELELCAFDTSVEEENRLLIPETRDGIDRASFFNTCFEWLRDVIDFEAVSWNLECLTDLSHPQTSYRHFFSLFLAAALGKAAGTPPADPSWAVPFQQVDDRSGKGSDGRACPDDMEDIERFHRHLGPIVMII
eukprot:scaffold22560_cov135-Cylindrotheca_fusiformis.AAC.31